MHGHVVVAARASLSKSDNEAALKSRIDGAWRGLQRVQARAKEPNTQTPDLTNLTVF